MNNNNEITKHVYENIMKKAYVNEEMKNGVMTIWNKRIWMNEWRRIRKRNI